MFSVNPSSKYCTISFQTTNITREEMSRTTNSLMTNIDCQLSDLKKKMEQQKIAEEQERLRKIQVGFPVWFYS